MLKCKTITKNGSSKRWFNVFSFQISMLHTCVLFAASFSAPKPKGNSYIMIFIENQLPVRGNQSHRFVTVRPIKWLPTKIKEYIFLLSYAMLDYRNLR